MPLPYTREQITDLQMESSQSTTLRLLYEILQWDVRDENIIITISIMLDELYIHRKISKSRIQYCLFIICCLESHYFYAFKEKWYVFDEDEGEIRRQLKIDFYIQLFTFIMLVLISILFYLGFDGTFPMGFILLLPIVYMIFVIYLALGALRPIQAVIRHKIK